ncbi:alpha/beta hydrolase [Streptomyces venezuelae]|uniref:alpha/beta fold hydrolase n=1 Tax=Streptomyces venezuelae TaxID=54571 RepID=UPI00123CE585|nr:alpha/beta hydrolase [Streptomyces venezuelae]QES15506.1 alpha/beta hydrolase [Streptomyces venezuelae]
MPPAADSAHDSASDSAPAPDSAFDSAYDELLAAWPRSTTVAELPTPYGATHLLRHGPEDGPPVLLLPGGGSTAASWRTTAAALGATHRVYAVDLVGGPGRSRPDGRPIRTAADLTAWLDAVLDGLGLSSAAFCGHSYGGWIALRYALAAPDRTDRLALLDPTGCFAGFRPGYLLRALPTLLRPTAARTAAFLAWESGGAEHDPLVRRLDALAAERPSRRPVTGPRPTPAELAALRPPALVLLAEGSRAHDARGAAQRAKALGLRTDTVPRATHHTLPATLPPRALEALTAFLTP